MTIWFGSDLHLNHKRILEFTDRPFHTIEEMNEAFLTEIDAKVTDGDTVYLLGDIVFANPKPFLARLNGKERNIHLIQGNHDWKETSKPEYWASISKIKNIKVDDKFIVLCHFPIEHWEKRDHGSWHLHGHTHNNGSHSIRKIPNRVDVGYDHTGQVLTSLEELELRYIGKGSTCYGKIQQFFKRLL